MRSQKIIPWLSLILMMLLGAGCASSNREASTPPGTAALPTGTATLIPTFTPTVTDTPVAIPTLPAEVAYSRLFDLLGDNGDCRLPCFLGITPGASSHQDALNVMAPFSGISDSSDFSGSGGSIVSIYTEGDFDLITNLHFSSDHDVVRRMSFEVQELRKVTTPYGQTGYESIFDSPFLGDRAKRYMLPQVLSEQGIPADVVVSTYKTRISHGGDGGEIAGGFDIFLFYPDRGLFVHYTTQMQPVGAFIRGCPAIAWVEMEMYPAGRPDSFPGFFAGSRWSSLWPVPDNPYYKPLEKAASMSVEQFYETFRRRTNACLETPADLWQAPG